jgi:hypothetical protein
VSDAEALTRTSEHIRGSRLHLDMNRPALALEKIGLAWFNFVKCDHVGTGDWRNTLRDLLAIQDRVLTSLLIEVHTKRSHP